MKISSRSYASAVLLGLICLMGLGMLACLGCSSTSVDLSKPVPEMDWIPRVRGSVTFEISTSHTNTSK